MQGGKILVAESAKILIAKLEMTGASLANNVLARLHKGGDAAAAAAEAAAVAAIQNAESTLLDAELWTTDASLTENTEQQGAGL